jgi:transcriptional regulator with XRE-family HTH domain
MGIVDTKEIGCRIKSFRQEVGLSQEALAELVGVSFQQVQKYESGHTTLNILKLQQIAEALKVSVADFFTEYPTESIRLTGEEDQLLQSYRRIKNTELRLCVLKLISNVNKRAK